MGHSPFRYFRRSTLSRLNNRVKRIKRHEMANTGLLVLSNPAKVRKLLPVIGEHVLKTLYIQYFPEKNGLLSANCSVSGSRRWNTPCYGQTVANIYALASTSPSTSALDIRILLTNIKNCSTSVINTKIPIELVIFDRSYTTKDAHTFMENCLANVSKACKFITLDQDKCLENRDDDPIDCQLTARQHPMVYKNVVLGGTFDRLHNGHKILFSEALLRCTDKLTVGITDQNMLTGKVLWELIESCPTRIANVKDYLEDVDASLVYDVVAIKDMYGPTRHDPTFQMIVVSEETAKGADKVNQVRAENGLEKLDVHVVKLVDDRSHDDHEEAKISSCNQRIRLLGTRLKEPKIKSVRSEKPYIIGLTGGIASGKSSVAEKLESLGAGVVHCDKLAHHLYEPGKKCYELVVEKFGPEILNANGTINREALGRIVFNDKDQLEKLNKAVWPAILEAATRNVDTLHRNGFPIIVMEAAVLIQAKWQFVCHEIWTCIIPHEEAVKRVMERNNLTETEANARIKSQPSNVDQVAEATVVFSTMWSHDVTLGQVQKAWNELNLFLTDCTKSQ